MPSARRVVKVRRPEHSRDAAQGNLAPPDTADWSHRLAFTYETPCRCAGIQLYATFPFSGGKLLKGPSVGVLLDLKSLGSFGLSST